MRNCCFTLNNYTEEEYKNVCAWDCDYLIVGKEVGEKGTPHLQGYVEWSRSMRMTELKKLNPKIHWEKRRGTAAEASAYCKKSDEAAFESGTLSQQGKRVDLDKIKNNILNGTRVDEIILEAPIIYHQYGRTLNKIEDLAMRRKFRTEMTTGLWLWGGTGVGKSHAAFTNYHPSTHYVVPNDNGWWDGYTQQDTIIINDFRGEIPYNELLQLVDKWPHWVKRRGREPMPFTSKHVIITSSLPPDAIYKNRAAEDSIAQLTRRFKIEKIAAEVVGGNTNPDLKKPDNLDW